VYAVGLAALLVIYSSFDHTAVVRDGSGKMILQSAAGGGAIAGFASLLVRCVFSVAQAINPLLPVSLAVGQSVSSTRLSENGVVCLAPNRIPMAGVIDTCVLDKTGTITQEGMELHSVHPVADKGTMTPEPISVEDLNSQLPPELKYLLATCHKLSKLQDQLIGNVVEVEMFKGLGPRWSLEAGISAKERVVVGPSGERLEVLRVLEFDHARMTSGAIVKLPNGEIHAFFKGAANKIHEMCTQGPVPADFLGVANGYSFECFYVLACAVKKIDAASVGLPREALESGLTARGMLLFKNEVKPDSAAALAEIAQGGIRSVMCTGDHLLTACSVGKQVGLIPDNAMILKAVSTKTSLEWEDMDTGDRYDIADLATLPEISLVIEQTEFDELRTLPEFRMVLPTIAVYARMIPAGKVAVIEELQQAGHYVSMCGDGGNDCGALRAAHVGLALSSSDSSIVSPFSSGQNRSLFRIGELVKEGRACLSNNLACYMFFINYGLGLTMGKVTLVLLNGGIMSEWQYLFFDVFICLGMPAVISSCRPNNVLSPWRPTASLLSLRVVSCCVGMHVLFYCSWWIAWAFLSGQPFYLGWFPGFVGVTDHDLHLASDNYECETMFILFAFHLVTCGVIYCYGGQHRSANWTNWRLMIMFSILCGALLSLVFMERTEWNCLFRVNCDAETSRHMPAALSLLSAGGHNCMRGPQIAHWADGGSAMETGAMYGQHVDAALCTVPVDFATEQKIPEEYRDAASIHNIFGTPFRFILVGILIAYSLLAHAFYGGCVLHQELDRMEQHGPEKYRVCP